MSTTKEIYDSTVRPLPPKERLQLAALILSDLTGPGAEPLEFESNWNDEDIRDLTTYAVAEATKSYPESEDLA
jgi:hypothetical protein